MTLVKICGISRVEDALAAANAGADFLGIVLEPRSRRCLGADDARRLVKSFRAQWHREQPQWVGVFANQPLEDVNHLLTHCDMDLAQLSGHEPPDYCLQVVRPVLKVIHVRNDTPAQEVMEEVKRSLTMYLDSGHLCMLDTFKQGVLGGTGQVFDWDVAQELARDHSFLLAGGLRPDNVSGAMRQVRPWGADVSSGVETDGQKDAAKIAQFIVQVRETDDALTRQQNSTQ